MQIFYMAMFKVSLGMASEKPFETFDPNKNRITACVSSQVGCSLNCKFVQPQNLKE